jgi:hypothetical protein
MWVPPAGWPAPPPGWAPYAGWQPEPNWPPVPADHQWWQPTDGSRSRRRTALVLVAVSSTTEFLFGIYGLVIRSLQDRRPDASHIWHLPQSPLVDLLLVGVWFYSMELLIPAGAIGAVELWGRGRSGTARAVALISLLCVDVCGELWTDQRSLQPSRNVSSSWLQDGRAWFALMCLIAFGVFALTVKLLAPPGDNAPEQRRASVT